MIFGNAAEKRALVTGNVVSARLVCAMAECFIRHDANRTCFDERRRTENERRRNCVGHLPFVFRPSS
jgi:hypothetical protein